jgi:hypothetical protein
LEAPTTPAKAEQRLPPGDPAAPPAEASRGQRLLPARPAETHEASRSVQRAELERTAAAEMPASLAEQPLPSPFAAVAAGATSPGSPRRRRSFGVPLSPGSMAVSLITSQAEWDALSVSSTRPRHSGHSTPLPHGGGGLAAPPATNAGFSPGSHRVRLQGDSEAEDEGEGERAPQLQQVAVPQAAISKYCRSKGLTMFWASARTGEDGEGAMGGHDDSITTNLCVCVVGGG